MNDQAKGNLMRKRGADWGVVAVSNGFVLSRRADGKPEFVGRDGYWTREPQNASPFSTSGEASAAIDREAN